MLHPYDKEVDAGMSSRSSHYYCNIHKTVPTEVVGSRGLSVLPVDSYVRCEICHRRAVQCESHLLPDDEVARDYVLLASVSLQHRIASELRGFWQRVFGA
jgi:hypothetical protein